MLTYPIYNTFASCGTDTLFKFRNVVCFWDNQIKDLNSSSSQINFCIPPTNLEESTGRSVSIVPDS